MTPANTPPNGKGRPTDPSLDVYRALFPEWSERTVARYAGAMRRLDLMAFSFEQKADVIRQVTRQNGTLNVARLDEITESMAAMRAARMAQVIPRNNLADVPPIQPQTGLELLPNPRGSRVAATATLPLALPIEALQNTERNSSNGSDWHQLAELPANCPLYRRAVVAVTRAASGPCLWPPSVGRGVVCR